MVDFIDASYHGYHLVSVHLVAPSPLKLGPWVQAALRARLRSWMPARAWSSQVGRCTTWSCLVMVNDGWFIMGSDGWLIDWLVDCLISWLVNDGSWLMMVSSWLVMVHWFPSWFKTILGDTPTRTILRGIGGPSDHGGMVGGSTYTLHNLYMGQFTNKTNQFDTSKHFRMTRGVRCLQCCRA